jgi:hypothetical protein
MKGLGLRMLRASIAMSGIPAAVATALLTCLAHVIDARAEEACWASGGGQFFDGIKYCVSSVRPPAGDASFGPENIFRSPESGKGWCAAGETGVGATVSIRVYNGAEFRSLLVVNGIAAVNGAATASRRIRTLEISTDTGVSTTVTLADQRALQSVPLPKQAKHGSVTLRIAELYPGADAATACLGYLSPDFEELERPLTSPLGHKRAS